MVNFLIEEGLKNIIFPFPCLHSIYAGISDASAAAAESISLCLREGLLHVGSEERPSDAEVRRKRCGVRATGHGPVRGHTFTFTCEVGWLPHIVAGVVRQ